MMTSFRLKIWTTTPGTINRTQTCACNCPARWHLFEVNIVLRLRLRLIMLKQFWRLDVVGRLSRSRGGGGMIAEPNHEVALQRDLQAKARNERGNRNLLGYTAAHLYSKVTRLGETESQEQPNSLGN
jgi:hypothetical protein